MLSPSSPPSMTNGPVAREMVARWEERSVKLRDPTVPLSPPTDLRSTSTVTATNSSGSEVHSRDGHSSVDSPPTCDDPSVVVRSSSWLVDEYELEELPLDESFDEPLEREVRSLISQQPASRGLPRCGVVNFKKEGDSLRWAPRLTQNTAGIAARLHNFEDAFSLEEFSSKALPTLWQAKGGNPRQSQSAEDKAFRGSGGKMECFSRQLWPKRAGRSASEDKEGSQTGSSGESEESSGKAGLAKSSSFKRGVVIAGEMRRPSFWSQMAKNVRVSWSPAQRCIEKEGTVVKQKSSGHSKKGARRSAWDVVVGLKFTRSKTPSREGKSAWPSRVSRKMSVFVRVFNPLEKRGEESTKEQSDGPAVEVDAKTEESTGDVAEERYSGERVLRYRHRNGENGNSDAGRPKVKGGFHTGRRVRSTLSATVSRRSNSKSASAAVLDDQYVKFMSPVV